MKSKRIISLILALVFCALAFVSCSKGDNGGEETTLNAEETLTDNLKNYTII